MAIQRFDYDYCKWLFRCETDLFQQYYQHFRDNLYAHFQCEDINQHHKVHAHGGYGGQERFYTLEVWGPAANVSWRLTGAAWFTFLQRVDIKGEVEGQSENNNYMVGMGLGMQGSRYMVQCFNQPARKKLGGKTAGGKGWALGSHKSGLRISAYNKTDRPVGLEFQVQGQLLDRLINLQVDQWVKGTSNAVLYGALAQAIAAVSYGRLKTAFQNAGMGPEVEVYFPTDGCFPAFLETPPAALDDALGAFDDGADEPPLEQGVLV